MSDTTKISWTDKTFNPWRGCRKTSTGCLNCYAEEMVEGWLKVGCWEDAPRLRTSATNWKKPLLWNREAKALGIRYKVFCGSLMDWAEDAPNLDEWRHDLFDLIERTPFLDWQLLTKRAGSIERYLPARWGDGWSNVWLGVTAENQEMANLRIPTLLRIPTVCRFVSLEPLLGPVDLTRIRVILSQGGICCGSVLGDANGRLFSPRMSAGNGIHWAIVGGESGKNFRPMDHQWARDIRAHCSEADMAFFFKQSANVRPGTGIKLDGQLIQQFPKVGK